MDRRIINNFCFCLIFLFIGNFRIFSQCLNCTNEVSILTSENFTINANEVLCIGPNGVVQGQITLNGGVLCNWGRVENVNFKSGTLENYGVFDRISGPVNIVNNGIVRINCYKGSEFSVTKSFNISANNLVDSIVINSFAGSVLSFLGDFSINKGYLKVFNGAGSVSDQNEVKSIFNVSGQLNISGSQVKIVNYSTGIFNVSKAINLDGKYDKTLLNHGIFNCNSSLNVSGNGAGSSVLITNNSRFNITKSVNLSYNNGNVLIKNFPDSLVKTNPILWVGRSISVSKENNEIQNNSSLFVEQDLSIEKGSLNNNGQISSRDVSTKFGTIINSGRIVCNRNLTVSNQAGVLTNNSKIIVKGEYVNFGTTNLNAYSLLNTLDFANKTSGTINGVEDIQPDSSNYPLLIILRNSDNNGYLNKNLVVYDITVSGSGIGLDNYNNNIAKLGGPKVIIGPGPCGLSVFSASVTASPLSPITSGTSVLLTATSFNTISLTSVVATNYLWMPANVNTVSNTFNTGPINSFVNYSVTATFSNSCKKTAVIPIYIKQMPFALLKKELDGGFFDVTLIRNPSHAGTLFFKFEEEYLNNGNTLTYKIYKTLTGLPITTGPLTVIYKDNRYSIVLGSGGLGLPSNNTFYILEATDKKGEKSYLRFKF